MTKSLKCNKCGEIGKYISKIHIEYLSDGTPVRVIRCYCPNCKSLITEQYRLQDEVLFDYANTGEVEN